MFFTHAQEKYSDIQIGTKYTLIQIKEAVNKASWCGYYHSEFEFELTFEIAVAFAATVETSVALGCSL